MDGEAIHDATLRMQVYATGITESYEQYAASVTKAKQSGTSLDSVTEIVFGHEAMKYMAGELIKAIDDSMALLSKDAPPMIELIIAKLRETVPQKIESSAGRVGRHLNRDRN